MGIHYSSYPKVEVIKNKKKIQEFYKLFENSNRCVVLLDEKNQVFRYNPFLIKRFSISPKVIQANVGHSAVSNNKPGGKGILTYYQPQFKLSSMILLLKLFEKVNQNHTAEITLLMRNTKNPDDIFFAKNFLRKIQIGKQTLTLISLIRLKETILDYYLSENEATIKKLKPKITHQKSKKREKKKKQIEKVKVNEKKAKSNSGNLQNPFFFDNFGSLKNYQPSIVELDSDSDQKDNQENTNHVDQKNDQIDKDNSTDDEDSSYDSLVEPLTDLENFSNRNSVNQNQNQNSNLNQRNNNQNTTQSTNILTCAFDMSNLIEHNYSNYNSSLTKNSKLFPNEPNSNPNGFQEGLTITTKKDKNRKSNSQKKNKNTFKNKNNGKNQKTTNQRNRINIQNKTNNNRKKPSHNKIIYTFKNSNKNNSRSKIQNKPNHNSQTNTDTTHTYTNNKNNRFDCYNNPNTMNKRNKKIRIREKFKAKFDTQQKYKTKRKFKNYNTNISINNITNKTNNYKINNINNTTNINININNKSTIKNTRNNNNFTINKINKINKNSTVNKSTVENTRNTKIHANTNLNKNKINNGKMTIGNTKIHANTKINKNNLNENTFNNKGITNNNKSTINNNIFKNRITIKNTIYKFVINDDQKFETDLEKILPCSKEIDNIFQDYELKSKSADSQLD
ncbi:hypothetical protein M0812_28509 [Anaeramoeba flamelloides]|uniref:Uncharacterized protein n=1 Tax=Anaeramoeba flamelloides TaxID=1746091 RepID=A0AAV7Y8A9_9EUKA|nr:hypothetical protein M0812_28509 [Anaeramoeba flamelloides]